MVCFAIDCACLVGSIRDFSAGLSPYADTSLLFLSTMLFLVDLYYLAWLKSLQHRVPPYLSSGFTALAFGAVDKLIT